MARKPKPTVYEQPTLSAMADSELGQRVAKMDDSHILCRDMGHAWQSVTARWDGRGNHFEVTLRCQRCKTERLRFLGPRGQQYGNRYTYAEGYQLKGIGYLSSTDRDTFRMAALAQLPITAMPGDDDDA